MKSFASLTMKSNPSSNPAKPDFIHASGFHLRSRFNPSARTDLVENPMLAHRVFWWERVDSLLADESPTGAFSQAFGSFRASRLELVSNPPLYKTKRHRSAVPFRFDRGGQFRCIPIKNRLFGHFGKSKRSV
jgi:hypothetical protein